MPRPLTLDEATLTRLLALRPDLVGSRSAHELDLRLASVHSTRLAVADLPAPQRQLLDALCLLEPGSTLSDLRRVDPEVDPERLRPLLAELADRALVTVDGEVVAVTPAVLRAMHAPLGLGRPVHEALEGEPHWALLELLANWRQPPQRSRDAARRVLGELFGDRAALGDVLARLDPPLRAWLERADAEGPVLRVPGIDPYERLVPEDDALLSLLSFGLLVATGPARVELPREVGVALRGPRVHRFVLAPPADVLPELPDVGPRAAERVAALLDAADRVVAALEQAPAVLLASGGVGVKEVRALAKAAGTTPESTATALALLHHLRLVDADRTHLRSTTRWPDWSAADDAVRWSELLRAWTAVDDEPAPVPGSGRRLKGVLAAGWDDRPREVRRQLVRLLSEQDAMRRDWAQAWAWRFPPERRAPDARAGWVADPDVRADVLAEAELLGLLVDGAPTPLVAVLRGAAPQDVLAKVGSAGLERVRAQADLTLVCGGRPSAAMRAALDGLGTVESTGAATVWRLSETSLAPAFDDGSTADDVLALLQRYAGELPQPMAYLVRDAERRHGRVVVGAAASYAVVADDAALQDVLRRRGPVGKRTAAAGLRRVAPTVAVADVPAGDLMTLLRELGLAATADAASGSPVPSTTKVKRLKPAGAPPLPPLVAPPVDPAAHARRLLG